MSLSPSRLLARRTRVVTRDAGGGARSPRRGMRRVLAVLALAAAALAHAPARAQGGGATVDVQVTDAESGEPVAGATVHLDGVPRAVSDSTGRIVIRGLGPGRHLLEVFMLGRRAVAPEIEVAGGEVLSLEVVLEPEPVAVPGVAVISVRGGTADARAVRRGGGRYLTRAEIARSGARRLSELLIRIGALQPNGHLRQARCAPKLVADGRLMLDADIDFFPIQDLDAVEVYSIAVVPPEFGGSVAGNCGIVAVWTRHD
ncbi:MAG: carboxypeptidase regulatory-like domain-containing protein [Longimicrobiaceae bacterium]